MKRHRRVQNGAIHAYNGHPTLSCGVVWPARAYLWIRRFWQRPMPAGRLWGHCGPSAWLKDDIVRRFGALPAEHSACIDSVESKDQLDVLNSRLDTATSSRVMVV